MITTYDLPDPATQQALADELCAQGFDAVVRARQDSEPRLTVTHPIEEVGRLDGLVYAAEPAADIAMTSVDGRSRPASPPAEPPADGAPRHRADIA